MSVGYMYICIFNFVRVFKSCNYIIDKKKLGRLAHLLVCIIKNFYITYF